MKILIYSANYAPEPTGIGKYSGEMAEWLAAAGHEVCVVAAPPYYPAWKVSPGYSGYGYRHEVLNGVRVWRAPLWVPVHAGGIARVLHLLSFALSSAPLALWLGLTWRPQVCVTVAPFFTCAPTGLLAAWLAGARSWLHVQDFEVDVAFGMGMLRGRGLRRAVTAVELFLFRRFDRVSSISARMIERAASKGVETDRLVFFRNWVDVDAVQPLGRPSSYRDELKIDADTVVVLYAGSLSSKQGLKAVPELARMLAERPRLLFVVAGDGAMKPELERQAAGLPNLRLLPLQPVERLGELLNLADIHLLTQDVAAEDLVLPSKLSGMLGSGRPVIATCSPNSEMAGVIRGRGIAVPPTDISALASAIVELADDPSSRKAMGQSARQFAVAQLGRDGLLSQFESDLFAVAGVPKRATSSS